MLYTIQQGSIIVAENEDIETNMIAIISREDMLKQLSSNDRFDQSVDRILHQDGQRFESHDKLDVLCMHVNGKLHVHKEPYLYVFLQKQSLWLVSDEYVYIDELMKTLIQRDFHDWTLDKVLFACMSHELDEETKRLNLMQDEINELEDVVISNRADERSIRKFIHLRKTLLHMERSYEQLLDMYDQINVNDNELLDEANLRNFQILAGRIDRLFGRVHSLQDYVTEIREAYQAEVDINLNVTMRIFTVITAIFLPLTLVAGWYGMNLKMPEYGIDIAYPSLIVISITIVVVLMIYFKRHKWF